MKTTQKHPLLCFLLVVGSSGAGILAQNSVPLPNLSIAEQQKRAKAARQVRILEAWTGQSDASFLMIEKSIDKAFASGQNISILVSQHKVRAMQNPADAKAQFRWAYAALKAAPLISEKADPYQGLRGVTEAMWSVPSPHSCRYDRLLFLLENFQINARELRPLAERLLKRNPSDLAVIYEFIPLLRIGKVPAEKQRALQLVQRLLKAQPRNPRYLSRLGYVYDVSAFGFQSQSDGEKAVAAYQNYLRLAPPDDVGRVDAQRNIRILKRYRHLLKKG